MQNKGVSDLDYTRTGSNYLQLPRNNHQLSVQTGSKDSDFLQGKDLLD